MVEDGTGDGRSRVLGRIGAALGREQPVSLDTRPAEVDAWISARRRHTLPSLQGEDTECLIREMRAALITIDEIGRVADVPDAIDRYLDSLAHQQSAKAPRSTDLSRITVAPALASLDWPWPVDVGAASGEESVGITPCFAAVAETGSIVLASGGELPMTLAFLPEIHIVLLHRDQIVTRMEDVHSLMRQRNRLPRGVNVITGPSRTADIEQTIEIGAHGPRYMHVLLIDAPSAS